MGSQVTPLTDESYWTTLWDGQQHKIRHLRWVYVANRQLAKLFDRALVGVKQTNSSLSWDAPIHCGSLISLKNMEVTLTVSIFQSWGANSHNAILPLAGVEGTILCEDLFAFAKRHRSTFDFVYSMGLIEHFSTPEAILEEMYNLLKPGGTMLTVDAESYGVCIHR